MRFLRLLAKMLPAAGLLLLASLSGHANAPPGRYSATTGAVLDNATGLTWQEPPPAKIYLWKEALDYCEALSLAGYSDWRLPSLKELETLVDESAPNPAIDASYFPLKATELLLFWSSSPYAPLPTSAWAVSFGGGSAKVQDIMDFLRVRCVR